MTTTNCKTFKGEIENYLVNGQNNIDSKINNLFRSLKLKTWLCRTNIVKKDGYHASHVFFVLVLLPMLRIKTVKGFCEKREKGVKSKAPVKVGKEQGVKVLRMVMDSDQPWPRVMRRLLVRGAAKR